VSASASATGPGIHRRRPVASDGPTASSATTAAKLSCHPTSATARGFSASVAAAASSSAYHREAGRPASIASSAAAPMTPARWIDGPPPASGT
jgi:hypothetical protein